MKLFVAGILCLVFPLQMGCSSERRIQVVGVEVCNNIHSTVLCPLGEDENGEVLTYREGIEGFEPDLCSSQELVINFVVHPLPFPDLPPTSASLVRIVEETPRAIDYEFELLLSPFDIAGDNERIRNGIAPACVDDVLCDEFLDTPEFEEQVLTFRCEEEGPVLLGFRARE